MIKAEQGWQETDWESALKHAAAGMQTAIQGDGNNFGALASSSSTLEEFFLVQKLARALGSENIDFRLQQSDFRDEQTAGLPVSEMQVSDYENIDAALLVGSNIRKEQPLLALRLRQAVIRKQAKISSLNLIQYQQNFDLSQEVACDGPGLVTELASVANSVAEKSGKPLPQEVASLTNGGDFAETAQNLLDAGENGLIVVGANALQHPDASLIKSLAELVAQMSGAKLAILDAANSVAGHIAACKPGVNGMNARDMLESPRKAYLLMGCEPELDSINSASALNAMQNADFVIQVSAFKSEQVMKYADVLLPMTGFAESAGTFINCNGKLQNSNAAAPAKGEARPGWKILRVMGNFLSLDGFDYVSLEEVTSAVSVNTESLSPRSSDLQFPEQNWTPSSSLHRIPDMPMYRGESTLRNAPALQRTADNPAPAARINSQQADSLNLQEGKEVTIKNGQGKISLPVVIDSRIPANSIYISAGHAETVGLNGHCEVNLES